MSWKINATGKKGVLEKAFSSNKDNKNVNALLIKEEAVVKTLRKKNIIIQI